MIVRPYWITSQLAIVPRPRGYDWLDDEMKALRLAGIYVVVSMLEKEESLDLGLEQEAASAQNAGLYFINFPIPDRSIPLNMAAFRKFLEDLEKLLATGKRIGVHCRACIGRASITTTSLLIRSGILSEEAWKQVSTSRGCQVPDTNEQREWVNQSISPNL